VPCPSCGASSPERWSNAAATGASTPVQTSSNRTVVWNCDSVARSRLHAASVPAAASGATEHAAAAAAPRPAAHAAIASAAGTARRGPPASTATRATEVGSRIGSTAPSPNASACDSAAAP